jgi:hypothetical protein
MTTPWKLPKSLRTRFTLVFAVALASVAAIAAATFDSRPAEVRAAEWVARHLQALPATLNDYAAYPIEYRREIRKALSPETQSRLWRAQLRGFLVARPDLTAEQRAFVESAIDVASPESFRPGADTPELCERIAQLFPNREDRQQLAKLGAGVTPSFGLRPALVTLKERIHARLTANASNLDCDCRGMGFCECSLLDACVTKECNQVEDCGCIFVGRCTNVCEFILNTMVPAPAPVPSPKKK